MRRDKQIHGANRRTHLFQTVPYFAVSEATSGRIEVINSKWSEHFSNGGDFFGVIVAISGAIFHLCHGNS